jgi:hypothetical protein
VSHVTYRFMPTPPAFEESRNRNLGSEGLLKLSTMPCRLSVGTEPYKLQERERTQSGEDDRKM